MSLTDSLTPGAKLGQSYTTKGRPNIETWGLHKDIKDINDNDNNDDDDDNNNNKDDNDNNNDDPGSFEPCRPVISAAWVLSKILIFKCSKECMRLASH